MNRITRFFVIFSLLFLFFSPVSFAADLSIEAIASNLQANQSKIKDMYCEMNTTIKQGSGAPMMLIGKMWRKGEDKSRMEMIIPMEQTVIRNGNKSVTINSTSGRKTVNVINNSAMRDLVSQSKFDIEFFKETFDLKVKAIDGDYIYIIEGTPKEKSEVLGKTEIYVDGKNWVSTKILIYDSHDKVMTQTQIEYQEISGAFVPVKSVTESKAMGMNMTIEVDFENVKVNQGISDGKFEI
ncbi:hypothetical protein A2230_07085 [candidate division WOR-1 bacterium RIFOXYA2_FULL_36_21]|uniref:Uncharacterized protein TP-0789 domain-containing protein n=1 Tax=candidate division WOR-1 bacterium RIFOXYB2_FULL_36_35 TaxID=1802578 RepID=A0A1F4S8M9_UNCSA|nr:MAG: hypothetical protein A2230_07085 [candidate division WOR-1 bacterium RIFOXYA2_FULL_36_21]OGC16772.1 MAG: hypothetical protein A2290_00240 [candidate division WOR-1 bacterium RIFOXYB2_FULL_36_35]OGC19740.1 MAG: hypothetical protein A2282_08925 [candidate division WOR-1 bacterium RIFOXYA12_FULL_36_13]